jgi:hypothetical protein
VQFVSRSFTKADHKGCIRLLIAKGGGGYGQAVEYEAPINGADDAANTVTKRQIYFKPQLLELRP